MISLKEFREKKKLTKEQMHKLLGTKSVESYALLENTMFLSDWYCEKLLNIFQNEALEISVLHDWYHSLREANDLLSNPSKKVASILDGTPAQYMCEIARDIVKRNLSVEESLALLISNITMQNVLLIGRYLRNG